MCDFLSAPLCCQLLQFPNYSSEVGAGTCTTMEMGLCAHPTPRYPATFSGHAPTSILLCSVLTVPIRSPAAQTLPLALLFGDVLAFIIPRTLPKLLPASMFWEAKTGLDSSFGLKIANRL